MADKEKKTASVSISTFPERGEGRQILKMGSSTISMTRLGIYVLLFLTL
jgi:hypothetical protein